MYSPRLVEMSLFYRGAMNQPLDVASLRRALDLYSNSEELFIDWDVTHASVSQKGLPSFFSDESTNFDHGAVETQNAMLIPSRQQSATFRVRHGPYAPHFPSPLPATLGGRSVGSQKDQPGDRALGTEDHAGARILSPWKVVARNDMGRLDALGNHTPLLR
jgi:hypothetical protein